MIFGLSWQKLMDLLFIIFLLNLTGIWPMIMRALGVRSTPASTPPPNAGPPPSASNLDMCYRLLGISSTAKWDEIERAYKAKAKKHHPDLGGDEDAMRALNEAYNMLKQSRRPR